MSNKVGVRVKGGVEVELLTDPESLLLAAGITDRF